MAKAQTISKAVIPAAGKGTRLLPLTKAIPKEMLPLGRKPVLEHIINEMICIGIKDVLFVISEEKTAIPAYFRDFPGINLKWIVQKDQKGLADAILTSEEFVDGDPFLVALGDSIITPAESPHATSRLLKCFAKTDAVAVINVQKTPKEECSRYGIVRPRKWEDQWFEIDLLVEKPPIETAPSDYAIAGRYAFDSCVFDYIRNTKPGAGGELQITDSIALMLNDNRPVWCVPFIQEETRRDIGTFESYFEAFASAVDSSAQSLG